MDFFTPMSEKDALSLNALVLAYVGDAVQSLYVRHCLALTSDMKAGGLHVVTSSKVKASAQSQLVDKLIDSFTETELSVYLRARNSAAHHKAKNQSGSDYRKASGFEAVLGFLYLTGNTERLKQLLETDL